MAKATDDYGLVQVNDADYGDGRVVIEAKTYFDRETGKWDWAVPAWEERGLGELEGTFATRDEAEAILRRLADLLPMYGFHTVEAA